MRTAVTVTVPVCQVPKDPRKKVGTARTSTPAPESTGTRVVTIRSSPSIF